MKKTLSLTKVLNFWIKVNENDIGFYETMPEATTALSDYISLLQALGVVVSEIEPTEGPNYPEERTLRTFEVTL